MYFSVSLENDIRSSLPQPGGGRSSSTSTAFFVGSSMVDIAKVAIMADTNDLGFSPRHDSAEEHSVVKIGRVDLYKYAIHLNPLKMLFELTKYLTFFMN